MALAEPWTEVVALQRDQARCAADIAAIKQACAKDHDKGHALECAQCWPRLVSRLRDLYFKPSSPEWFTGRRDFLQDLDNLFTKAQSSQNATLDLKPIDQRVRKEKEGWFRDKAADLGLLKATQSQGEARELQSKLSDRELPVEQLVSELRNTFPAARPDSSNETFFRQFLEQMGAAQSPKEQAGIYTEVVFKADQNSAESAKTEKYAKLINGGTPPGQALETLLRDRESSQGEQDDRRRLRNQLEELRRAKAAYQLAQSRRDKVRQEKARATAAAAAAASARKAPTLPSCATCSGAVDPQSFEMCSICQVLSSCEAGVSEPVLWCSEQCRNQTFVSLLLPSAEELPMESHARLTWTRTLMFRPRTSVQGATTA